MATPDKQAIEEKSAEKESAVVPLASIGVEEVAYAARLLDGFLRRFSHDVAALDRMATAASAVPILGDVMAIIDVVGEVFSLATSEIESKSESLLKWGSLAINLIGLVPGAGKAPRVALRPTLTLARQAVKTSAHAVDEALVVMLVAHLNATLAGTIDKFVKGAVSGLGPMLDAAGAKLKELTDSLSGALTRLANGQIFLFKVHPEPAMSTSEREYKNAFSALVGAFGAGAKALEEETARRFKAGGNAAFAAAVEAAGVKQPLLWIAEQVQRVGLESKQFVAQQRDGGLEMSIAFVLAKLEHAAVAHVLKQAQIARTATVGAQMAEHDKEIPGVELGQKAAEPPTEADPRPCAGHGVGLNNSGLDIVPSTGPLPIGSYTISPQRDNVTGKRVSLPGSMRLAPDADNWMYGRGGFLIHGDNSRGGCIVEPRNIRDLIGSSADRQLKVVP